MTLVLEAGAFALVWEGYNRISQLFEEHGETTSSRRIQVLRQCSTLKVDCSCCCVLVCDAGALC